MRALSAAAHMHVHRRHLVLKACRKFGVTTPDIKAREREREGGDRGREIERERERERERRRGGKRSLHRFKDISLFSAYFSCSDFINKLP